MPGGEVKSADVASTMVVWEGEWVLEGLNECSRELQSEQSPWNAERDGEGKKKCLKMWQKYDMIR